MGRNWGRHLASLLAAASVAAVLVGCRTRSVADLAGLGAMAGPQGMEITMLLLDGDGSPQRARFYREDPALAGELAESLGAIRCRRRAGGALMHYREGQALAGLCFFDGTGAESRYLVFLDDGRVYCGGKCYSLAGGCRKDCITGRLEEILRECPEDAEVF